MKRIVNALGKLNPGKRACAVLALCATTAIALPAQTLTTLHSFDGADGGFLRDGLVQATNGKLYGTTPERGYNRNGSGAGTIFQITPTGTLTTLFLFCYSEGGCVDGSWPYGSLVQATNGYFYGTTSQGGANARGTVFKTTPSGTLTSLYSFCSQSGCPDGETPDAGLVQATDGNFYGTTSVGGTSGGGTVFRITPGGMLTTLYTFCTQSGCPDGFIPSLQVQATDGDFYGITLYGGANDPSGGINGGTVFRITPSGMLTTLYSFCSESGCTDGAGPSGLVQTIDGSLYGTTGSGGAGVDCMYGCGTVFKITPSGTLTTLYSFCTQSACRDGVGPGGLVQATDGSLYGTTGGGGANGAGTIFRISPSGLSTLYSFCSQSGCTDGNEPNRLVQDTSGDFYGTTYSGGAHGDGTVFSLSVGLGPFVKILQAYGRVGAAVEILGTDLTGASSVTFNGSASTYTVNSTGTAISTTVPDGATTGTVKVVTSGGTLSSNVPFRVLP